MSKRSRGKVSRTDVPTNGHSLDRIVDLERELEAARRRAVELAVELASLKRESKEVAQKAALLTQREREVLQTYIEHPNHKEVARLLGTRPQTVANQLSAIEQKFGATSRVELVAIVLGETASTKAPDS